MNKQIVPTVSFLSWVSLSIFALASVAPDAKAETESYPLVNSYIDTVSISYEQCLDRAFSVLQARGYSDFATVGSSPDTSVYGRRSGMTAIIRCATQRRLGLVILATSTQDVNNEFNQLARDFFGSR